MKKIKYLIALMIVSAVMVTSCKKNDDNSSNSGSTSSSSLSTVITAGSWHVSYYHQGSDDHTTNFNGYTFTFASNGTMTATNTSGTTNGTWSMDDSHNEFHMTIGSTVPLSDISNGWTIITKSSTEIKMQDDSSSHSEELHFVKV